MFALSYPLLKNKIKIDKLKPIILINRMVLSIKKIFLLQL